MSNRRECWFAAAMLGGVAVTACSDGDTGPGATTTASWSTETLPVDVGGAAAGGAVGAGGGGPAPFCYDSAGLPGEDAAAPTVYAGALDEAPLPAGGTVEDGDYFLTSLLIYSDAVSSDDRQYRSSLMLAGDHFSFSTARPDGVSLTAGDVTYEDTSVSFRTWCGSGYVSLLSGPWGYSVDGTDFVLIFSSPGDDPPRTSVHTWTRQ